MHVFYTFIIGVGVALGLHFLIFGLEKAIESYNMGRRFKKYVDTAGMWLITGLSMVAVWGLGFVALGIWSYVCSY